MAKASREDVWVEGPAGRLRATRCGEGGTPVLFVHGNSANRSHWEAQLAHVCRTRMAVTYDLRGMGESALAADGDYSVSAMVEDAAAVARHFGLGRFVIVGHSYGAAVVGAFAARYPERLAGVVYADAGGDYSHIDPKEAEAFLANFSEANYPAFREVWFTQPLENARPETRERVMASLRANPRVVLRDAMAGVLRFNPVEAARAYKGPQLDITTERLTGPEGLAGQVPELPRQMMRGVSHWLMMDAPEEFNRHLDAFLAVNAGPRGG